MMAPCPVARVAHHRVIVLLLFGGSQLPKLARSLGEAQKEFKKGPNEDDDDDPHRRSVPPA